MSKRVSLRACLLMALMLTSTNSLVAADVDFNRDVLPILSDKCFACHGPDANHREADLRLDNFSGATADLGGYVAIAPGDLENSEILHRIDDADAPMPPPESKLTLSKAEKDVLQEWVKSGAKYAMHWAFVPPQRPTVPESVGAINSIDNFIERKLQKADLKFSPEATPQTLIRRVTLDLTGLPPTLLEVDAFVATYSQDKEQAYSELVDRLLASPRYGETMALPWLDAARYADTDGYQYDGPRFQWRWRDWVIDAYNQNMPFDQFTVEQLAGDLLPDATLEQRIATGFNRNHRYNSEAGIVVEEFLLENAVDRVDTTATLWMGLTMGCARCHDHKYDAISQRDYYQMIAFFNSVPEAGRAIKSGNSEPIILAPTKDQQIELAKFEAELATLKSNLLPGDVPQNGGPLIDRKLTVHHALDQAEQEDFTLRGTPKFEGKSLVLDGESSVEVGGQKKSLNLAANKRFTISFWLKPTSVEDSIILSRQNPGTTRSGVELALVDDGKLRFDLISRWVAGVGRATTKQQLPLNEWMHVTVSNDGSQSANGQLVYFNGIPVETEVTYNTNSNTGGVSEKQPIRVGAGIRPNSKKFVGAMRELRMYETNLWSEEVAILGQQLGSEDRKRFSRIKMTPEYPKYVALREKLDAYKRTLPTLMVMQDAPEPKPTFLRTRGVYNAYGEEVQRDVPGSLPPLDSDLPKNRLGLATWLVSKDHPLTARVAVNRYWQKHFGTALVKTAEDFGVQGDLPSHSELLDWLAVEFMESGWNVKTMHKLIVSSRTYRQQSRLTPDLIEKDPENRLLARGPRLRLSGHAIRDQSLLLSGLLKEQIGGPSVSPYQPANLWAEMSMGMKYKQSTGDDLYRRSLYTIWKRTVAPPSMSVFDAADREACWVNRKQTNTPLQALTLLNETGFVESARHLAVKMMHDGGDDPIGLGFRMVTQRAPTSQERELLQSAHQQYLVEYAERAEDAKKLISTGASPVPKDVDVQQLAAYTSLANVLLNLDEVITRE